MKISYFPGLNPRAWSTQKLDERLALLLKQRIDSTRPCVERWQETSLIYWELTRREHVSPAVDRASRLSAERVLPAPPARPAKRGRPELPYPLLSAA